MRGERGRAVSGPRWLGLSLGCVACGGALRAAPLGLRPAAVEAPIAVSEPPPVNKVETVPRDPGAPCAWLDGRWEWVDRAWEWTPGAWVVPPSGCHFAPPETTWATRGERGELFYFPGRWYPDAAAGSPCGTPQVCGATAPRTP